MQKSNKRAGLMSGGVRLLGCAFVVNVLLFCGSIYLYLLSRRPSALTQDKSTSTPVQNTDTAAVPFDRVPLHELIIDSPPVVASTECTDPVWCSIPMPSKSHYKFDPPSDLARWKQAQILASGNSQVLLEEIVKVFPHPLNFLDGDRQFRRIHYLVDIFVDNKKNLLDLTTASKLGQQRRVLKPDEEMREEWYRHVPENYDFRASDRAPVLEIGFGIWQKDSNSFFSGNRLGYSGIDRGQFLKEWKSVKDTINTPFIAFCEGNENWGMLSTNFPNRTAGWGQCCNTPKDKLLLEFLDHEMTLMLMINQHSNISHPKLLTLPRGLPLTWAHTERLVWDSQRFALKNVKKQKLLFSASSSWGKRPQMLRCVSDKMTPEDFEGHVDTPKEIVDKTKVDRRRYYQKLASAKFGLSLPGLGYDCFKTWEMMTMGTIIILERGVGLDKTLWRLPALLVDDFDDVNPTLLRSAYVEAVYRAKEFEFQRLTQGYWWSVIANVSSSKSSVPLYEAFPMKAEDETFTRPKVPYSCAAKNACGKGTKRIPPKSC